MIAFALPSYCLPNIGLRNNTHMINQNLKLMFYLVAYESYNCHILRLTGYLSMHSKS